MRRLFQATNEVGALRWLPLTLALAAGSAPGCDSAPRKQGTPTASPAKHAGAATGSSEAPAAAEAEDTTKAPSAPPAKAPLVKEGRPLMSTFFELAVAGPDEPRTHKVLLRGLDEIARLETLLSEWKPGTEISELNRHAGDGSWVPLSEHTFAVVQAGVNVSTWSEGAYDLSWAAMHGLYKFDGSKEVPSREAIEARLALVGYGDIELVEQPPQARLKREGMAIGTGSIAKGYALDRVAAHLKTAALYDYLLFAGGQVQVRGTRGGRPWRVGIQHPRDPRSYIAFLELRNGSVSTSGDYEHAFVDDKGTLWHHIIDLKTGLPARRSVSVTFVAPSGMYADALSTACFVQGPEGCAAMVDRLPFDAEYVIIDSDLRVHVSPGLKDKIHFTVPLEDGRLPQVQQVE